MGIILRLEGVNVKAGPGDIRQFFDGLYIPDGGVYIIGGSLKEAFIAFGNEKDGHLAIHRSGKPLKGSIVTLHISSVSELEHKLKLKLQGNSSALLHPAKAYVTPQTAATQPPEDISITDPKTALFCNLLNYLHGLKSNQEHDGLKSNQGHDMTVPSVPFSKSEYTSEVGDLRTPKEALVSEPGYVRLFGLPTYVTKEDISIFFQGLQVQEVITNIQLGVNQGCIVKFAHLRDAYDALNFNNQWMGPTCVEVRSASEKMWISALQECKGISDQLYSEPMPVVSRQKSEPLLQVSNQSPVIKTNRKIRTLRQSKRTFDDPFHLKHNRKPRYDCTYATVFSKPMPNYVMVRNLPTNITKTDIKELFGCQKIPHNKIIHLQDDRGLRTDTAFVIFDHPEDYEYALNLDGCSVQSRVVNVSSVSKKTMLDMLASARADQRPNLKKKTKLGAPRQDATQKDQTCLYVRNMPGDVQKAHVQAFFRTFRLQEDDIFLMRDNDGNGIGEAVIQFKSAKLAAIAQRRHGRNLLGVNVLLKCISVKQMEDLLSRNT